MPFVGLMMLAVLILCIFPQLSLVMPDWVLGARN
jgi:TRAP-type C4-dicarboxylate transport system permease large subunit